MSSSTGSTNDAHIHAWHHLSRNGGEDTSMATSLPTTDARWRNRNLHRLRRLREFTQLRAIRMTGRLSGHHRERTQGFLPRSLPKLHRYGLSIRIVTFAGQGD